MKKLKGYLLFAGLLVLMLSPAKIFAGDYANLNFIGFSKDGKFLAFEEYGTSDGAGFPYSNIYFIETEKNSYASAPVKVFIENENSTEAKVRNKSKLLAAKTLLKLKIVAANTGTHVVSHLITDLSNNPAKNSSETVKFAEQISSNHQQGDYQLSLDSILTKTKECEDFGFETYKLELSLKNNENNAVSSLQKDAALPKSRGCAMSYRIQDVFLYDKYIAVILNMNTPGFEGPDMRFLTVAGKLN